MSFLEENRQHWTTVGECFLWTGSLDSKGYGQKRIGGRTRRVPRLVCEETYGPPPSPKHQAAHDTPNGCAGSACINPDHLRWATQSENQLDIPQERRSERVRKVWAAMTPEQRSEIGRKAYAATNPEAVRKRGRAGAAALTSEQRRKAVLARTPELRLAISLKAAAAQTPEQHSERVRKGWETRRRKGNG